MDAHTAFQVVNARTMWAVFEARPHWMPEDCATAIGCSEGEASLLFPAPKGDHGEAGGGYQLHHVRRDIVLKHTGIDVYTAGAADTAKAFLAEISEPWAAPYNKVEMALLAAVGVPEKMKVLISMYERSGDQPRDIARRTPMAEQWLARALNEGWGTIA